MKTRRLLTALTLVATFAVAASPVRADWNDPIGSPGPGSSSYPAGELLLEAATMGFEVATVAL